MEVRICGESFDPWQALADYQHRYTAAMGGKFGATAVFVGTMRDFNEDRRVSQMELEHYPGMTEKHLRKVGAEALEKWNVVDVFVVHRYGTVTPNEPIVLVAVWAAHRQDAFAACRFIIDELKLRAPFWKQEATPEGSRWVQGQHLD